MTSPKKIEKMIRKNRHRSFHPAVGLLARADQELALPRALATHHYGVEFERPSYRADTFFASTAFEPGELRHLCLFAEIPGYGEGAEARCGIRMEYFVPGKSVASCVLNFARLLREPGWVLEVKRAPRGPAPDSGILHALRRMQLNFDEPYRLRHDEDVIKVHLKILKDYHEIVLIPRKAQTA